MVGQKQTVKEEGVGSSAEREREREPHSASGLTQWLGRERQYKRTLRQFMYTILLHFLGHAFPIFLVPLLVNERQECLFHNKELKRLLLTCLSFEYYVPAGVCRMCDVSERKLNTKFVISFRQKLLKIKDQAFLLAAKFSCHLLSSNWYQSTKPIISIQSKTETDSRKCLLWMCNSNNI